MKRSVNNKYGHCYYCLCEDRDCAMIYNLYVGKVYRRKGHATELVQCCIKKIRKVGYCGDISIVAEPEGNSISKENLMNFYKKLGLKIIDR